MGVYDDFNILLHTEHWLDCYNTLATSVSGCGELPLINNPIPAVSSPGNVSTTNPPTRNAESSTST